MPVNLKGGDVDYDWTVIKAARDQKLTDTDWTQLSNSPLTVQEVIDYAIYRQKLRDIPQDYPNAWEVVWPSPPAVTAPSETLVDQPAYVPDV